MSVFRRRELDLISYGYRNKLRIARRQSEDRNYKMDRKKKLVEVLEEIVIGETFFFCVRSKVTEK